MHDALLIEDTLGELDRTVERARELMIQVGAIVLNGCKLRVDAEVFNRLELLSLKSPKLEPIWYRKMDALKMITC